MYEAKKLDLSGGWEDIVNNVERHNARAKWEARRQFRRLNKLKQGIVNLSLGALLAVLLGFTGLMEPWVAGVVAVALVCVASAIAGRLWEACSI